MTEKPNYPVVTPYPKHFWHDAFGCHWCNRKTDSMVSGHDGMCPVPVVAQLEVFKSLWIEYLAGANLYSDGSGIEIPEELSGELDIGLPLARRICKALGGE